MNKEEQHINNLLKDIPIVWINLERSETRRNNKIKEFKKYNLNHTRIEAVDGNKIYLEKYKETYCINEIMSKYEIACAFSHMKAIKYCYDKGLEFALILEDDCTFEYFKYKTESLMQLLEELKTFNGECLQLANIINKSKFLICKKIFEKNKFKKDFIAGAQSYLITRNGMKKILDNFENHKNIQVSELMIFGIANNFLTPPYFSYPFLRNQNGEKTNLSTIRENTKSAHATQTISKQLWDEYYNTL